VFSGLADPGLQRSVLNNDEHPGLLIRSRWCGSSGPDGVLDRCVTSR
jgi:hypothetical protein